jgi:phosphotransferase system IIB component
LLSNEYIKNFGIKENIDYVTNLSTDLLYVYKRMIKNNTWLSPHTKKQALKKLDHLKIIIGSHDSLIDDPILDYTNDDVWENIEKIYNMFDILYVSDKFRAVIRYDFEEKDIILTYDFASYTDIRTYVTKDDIKKVGITQNEALKKVMFSYDDDSDNEK